MKKDSIHNICLQKENKFQNSLILISKEKVYVHENVEELLPQKREVYGKFYSLHFNCLGFFLKISKEPILFLSKGKNFHMSYKVFLADLYFGC